MKIKKTEIIIASTVFFLLFSCLTALKVINWVHNQGDSAIVLQMLDSVQKTGKVYSEAGGSAADLIFDRRLVSLSLEEIKKIDLAPSTKKPMGGLSWHLYLILYLFMPFGFMDLTILFSAVTVLSFVSMLVVCYFYLRKAGVAVLTSILFVLLAMSHPAFSISIFGQLYIDRFFIGFAAIFAFLCSIKNRNKFLFILIALLGASVVMERTGLLLGMFAVLHFILYFDKKDKAARIKLFTGIGLALLSFIALKLFIDNLCYGGYLITSVSAYLNYLKLPGVIEKILIFIFFSSMLWLLSIFDWRASIIALIMLLPNLFGNIGGAEKTGWATHYHTYYFPFLVWAATMGLIKLYGKTKHWIASIVLCVFIVLTCTKNPYTPGFSFSNVKDNIIVRSIREARIYFLEGNAKKITAITEEFRNSIPKGSKISAVEAAWCPFYNRAHIYYYPLGIKDADYVILLAQKIDEGYKYSGFISYRGPQVAAEIDEYLLKKLEEYGYDLKKPVYVSPWGHAVIGRKDRKILPKID